MSASPPPLRGRVRERGIHGIGKAHWEIPLFLSRCMETKLSLFAQPPGELDMILLLPLHNSFPPGEVYGISVIANRYAFSIVGSSIAFRSFVPSSGSVQTNNSQGGSAGPPGIYR